MTNAEAIERIKEHITIHHYTEPHAVRIGDALAMAIDALEKQIPKSVRVTTSTKRCAVCGRQLSGIGNLHPERKYCQNCGQAIKWT